MILVGITLSLTVFFPIVNLSATGSKIYSSEEIVKHSGIKLGDNLFVISRTRAEDNLKSTLPFVESIEFKRKIPDTLTIAVKDAKEFACYSVNKRYFTVSESGWVLKETAKKPSNLIEIIMDDVECKVGSQIVLKEKTAKEITDTITDSLKTHNISLNKINLSDKLVIKIKVENRFTVNLGTSNNLQEKIRHLSSMIKEIDPKKQGEINLSMWTSDNTQGTFKEKKEKVK